ncbi:PAS domain-containing sensor histidine kinase [Flavobacterium seoulense]|uniref:histidine kinase n=1 Tax=Flavobacterium seoulense TaxID=1492738 RepID=A0A066WXF0_9FLAO|nr:PAS domain S-box protein [Flavobacterium seoulense]KDN55624.1 histidine kinase [Flavobacterium seoulense]
MEQIKNNDLFKTIFNSVPNGITVMKFVYNDKNEIEDFLIMMLNAYNRDLLGDIDYNEQLYSKVFPAAKNNGILQKFIETAQTGIVSNFDQWYEDENRKQWFRFIAVKQADLLVVTTEDITEKKQAEIRLTNALEAAEKQRRLYSSITNNTPDLVYVFDLNYNFTYANKALLKMWGKSAKDAIGKGLRDNGYEEWHALMHEREIDEIVATKKMIRSTVSFPHAELGKRIYDYILTPVVNEKGIVEAVAGITRDITDIKLSEQKRELSERRLKSMIEQTPAPTLVLKGDDLVIEQINKHMLQMIGRGKEIIGMPLIDVLPELKGQYVWEQVKNVYNKGISFDQSEVLVPHNRTGKICDYYYNLAYRPLIDDGQITGMIQVAVDVTEQVVARKKLEESENRFRALINASSDVVYYINADWTIMSNLDGGFLSGHSNLVSNWLNKYIHPLDKEKVIHLISESILNKSIFELEHRILNADDSIGWIFSRVVPILDHDNEVIEWFGNSSDITSQKEIQEVIKESEEKFRLLADMVPQIIWTSEPDGFVDYYNKRWYEYTNSKETELGDASWYLLLHPDDVKGVEELWYKSIKEGDSYQVEFRLKNANTGQYRWFLGQALPVKDKTGAITKWFGTCTDIHEHKTVTEKLELLVAERTKELQRSNEDLQQFAHVASHDLKEPVRKIKTFTSRLEEYYKGNIDETAAKFIDRIHVAADRMFNMIDGVLAYSKINANLRQSTLVDLNEVIKNIETDLEVALQRSNGIIKYDHLPTIEGATVLLYQLFYNLINNSIKFAKDDIAPEISITSEIDSDTNTAIITLKDNGIGFRSDQADLIFETFSRLNSKDKYEGTGLGLSLCKKIAERHGGKITASGSNANGAEFIITLPLKQNENNI